MDMTHEQMVASGLHECAPDCPSPDEERAAFKRSEYEAMRGIVAGDLRCPDPSAHTDLYVERLARAIHHVRNHSGHDASHEAIPHPHSLDLTFAAAILAAAANEETQKASGSEE